MGNDVSCMCNENGERGREHTGKSHAAKRGKKDGKGPAPYAVQYLGDTAPPQRVSVDKAVDEAKSVQGFTPWDATNKTKVITRALFIGINYCGTRGELSGCCNDVKQMLSTLNKKGFFLKEAKILADHPGFEFPHELPTRQNIINCMAWLSHDAKPGDVLFVHYSGHGVKAPSINDEFEKFDQCLAPLDFEENECIRDDDIFELLVAKLPKGVRLTAVFDCCHSGTLLDLPYSFIGSKNLNRKTQGKMQRVRGDNESNGDVLMISGCNDEQQSADVKNAKAMGTGCVGAGGAATQCLTYTLLNKSNLTYQDMLVCTRDMLREKKFTQVPQLSSSKPIDLQQPFSLTDPLKTV